MNATLSFLLFMLLMPLTMHAQMSTEEDKIAAIAKEMGDPATRLLEQVANINSGTMNPEGVREVGKILQKEFDAIGFQTKWIDMPTNMNRAGHLFAERKGNRGKRLLLIGHLDTVFEKDEPFQNFQRKGSTATGQGVSDMKGGDVVMLYALKALHQADVLDNTQIIAALIGDEEMAGDPIEISRRDLMEAGKRSDVALGFEPAIGMDSGTVARRGIAGWILRVTGKQAHSAGIFTKEDGSGAIFETARILNAFHDQLREPLLTFNPAVIVGGTEVKYDSEQSRGTAFGKSNVIPRAVTVEGDIRFISNEQHEKARQRMREIVKSGNHPHTSATIEFTDGYPAMPPKEANYELLKMLDQVSQDLGIGPVKAYDPGGRGAADISFVAPYVAGLDGLGAMGEGAHAPEESIDLKTLPALIQRAAILIYRLTR